MPGWHRNAVQVVSEHDRAAERRGGLLGELLVPGVLVALREMREDKQPRSRIGGDAAGLPGGQVPYSRASAASVSAKVDSHTSMSALIRERERTVAEPGVHDERETLTGRGSLTCRP